MNDTTYLITESEFVVLAAAADMQSLYGFELHADKLNREKSVYTLQELLKKGYVQTTENGFLPVGIISDIFANIRDAKTTVEVHKKSGKAGILYVGDQTVHVARSLRRTDTYEVGIIPFAETWRFLIEEGWIYEPLKNAIEETIL